MTEVAAAADEGWVTFLCVLSLSSERTSRVRVILSFSSKPSRAKRFASERQMLHLDTHQPPASGMHGRGFAEGNQVGYASITTAYTQDTCE